MAAINELLARMEPLQASDLHLKVGMRPRYRISGELVELPDTPILSREQVDTLTREILNEHQLRRYEQEKEIDFAYGDVRTGRYRCNYFLEYRGPAAVFRRIPSKIPTLRELNLPQVLEQFAHLRGGLVLVTGPTGCGKTSTLASLIHTINSTYRKHIITLEDPIEFLHANRKSIVHQRGVHYDIPDFATGIAQSLREDPDVLLIGEMRDLESIRQALTAAETGVLVMATLHTNGARQTIDRIIDVFPSEEQPQIRSMLSQALSGVISQVLLTRTDGQGFRIPACEIMFSTPAISSLIRENKVHEIPSVMLTSKGLGMQTMDDSLINLVARRLVSVDEAYSYAENKPVFEQTLKKLNSPRPG